MSLQLDLPYPGCRINQTGIEFDSPEFATWRAVGERISSAGRTVSWMLADWAAHAKARNDYDPAAVAAAIAATGFDPAAVNRMATVARRVPNHCRRPRLSIEAHAAVAKYDPDEQQTWLDYAEAKMDSGQAPTARHIAKAALLGREPTARDMAPAKDAIPTHIPHINRLVAWWAGARAWASTAERGQLRCLRRDLEPLARIIDEIDELL